MEIVTKKWNTYDLLEIRGRIDGLTSAGLKLAIDQAAVEGRRNVALGFAEVSYMSSAGLRVILQSHKTLEQIGGRLTLVAVPPTIMDVLNISGMAGFLHILEALSPPEVVMPDDDSSDTLNVCLDGISFELRKVLDHRGKFFSFGSDEKLLNASYGPADPARCKPAEMTFGLGLAALGDDYSDYKLLFGEAVVIGHHFFSYPAVVRPVVDYSFFLPESQHSLNFLYGFGMNGSFANTLRFDSGSEPLSIDVLLKAAAKVAESDVFGVVILGVSGGIHGMHLKKSPVSENKLSSGGILDTAHFPLWMDFSIESEEINKTIVAVGIVVKTPEVLPLKWKRILPENGEMHLHAAIFENGLWSNSLREFGHELMRIVKEFEPQKVLHLLPDSNLKSGFIGIINLEEN